MSGSTIDRIVEIEKFNPYHDARGRFASANSAISFNYRTKDPNKQYLADSAREREKERTGYAPGQEAEETPCMKAIHAAEDKIRHQNYETAVVIDKDGNEVINKDGGQNNVGFTPMECFMLRNNTLTHNHPRSSMFSTEDTLCFVKNEMEEVRATTREGVTYSIKRGEGYNRNKGMEFVVEYDGNYKKAINFAQHDLDSRGFREQIMNGNITQEQANREFTRVVTNQVLQWTTANAPKYGVDFTVENRTVKKSHEPDDLTIGKAEEDTELVLDSNTANLEDEAFQAWLNNEHIKKSDEFEIFKTSDDKRLVFGWASVSIKLDGEQLLDRQQDLIDPEDLEAAAYEYVLNFRDTGELHNPDLRKKGKLVESVVFTKEKQRAMGIPDGIVPVGWWIGFKIEDDEAWEKVKNGTYKMFSIEGRAHREPVTE